MKAGIYRSPNGNLIYVAKDRTVKAANLSPSTWPGMKVSHRAKDDTVTLCGYTFTRFADVPNGCTDHAKALADASAANKAEIEAILGPVGDADMAARVEAIKRTEDPVSAAMTSASGKGNKPGYEYKHVVNEYPTAPASGDANPLGPPSRDNQKLKYTAQGYRLCHGASARKHRKRGDVVVSLGHGSYAWKPSDNLFPYQQAAVGEVRPLKSLEVTVGAGE